MKDKARLRKGTIEELQALRRRIAELERGIEESNRATEQLRADREKLRSIVGALEYGITVQDRDYNIIYQNDALKNTFSGLGEKCYRVYEGRNKVCDGCPVEMAYRDGGTHSSERRVTMPSGDIAIWENTANPIRNAKGEIVSCLEVTRNITERRQLEQKYETIVRTSTEGFAVADMERRLIDVNDAYCLLTGYSRGELLKMRIEDIEVAEKPEQIATHFQKIMKLGKDHFETRHRRKDGKIVDLEVTVNYLEMNGGLMVTFLHDTTERKRLHEALQESEVKYRTLVENANEAIFIVQGEMIRFANPYGAELTGYPAEELTSAKSFLTFLHPDDRQAAMQRYLGRQEDVAQAYTGRIVDKGGNIKWIEAKLVRVMWRGSPAIMGLATDVTQRKQAEEELIKSQNELRRLSARLQSIREEERTVIARRVHDELGQALAALKMDLSWLRKRTGKDEETLLHKLEQMSQLIDEETNVVRSISAELRPRILDELSLTDAIEWQARQFQERTGIRCKLNITDQNVVVKPDCSTAIFRILEEALNNVFHHAKATEVEVSLKEKSGNLVLEVRDNGKGIAEEHIHSSDSLGLIGIRERAYSCGGDLRIRGVPSKGTRLAVSIPLDKKGGAR